MTLLQNAWLVAGLFFLFALDSAFQQGSVANLILCVILIFFCITLVAHIHKENKKWSNR